MLFNELESLLSSAYPGEITDINTYNQVINSLENALHHYETGNNDQAIHQLDNMIKKIESESGHSINTDFANKVIGMAEALINSLGG
jgi:hypothetical protein